MKRLRNRATRKRLHKTNENTLIAVKTLKKTDSKLKQKVHVTSAHIPNPEDILDTAERAFLGIRSENVNYLVSSVDYENDDVTNAIMGSSQAMCCDDVLPAFGSSITSSLSEHDIFNFSNDEFSPQPEEDMMMDILDDVETSSREKETMIESLLDENKENVTFTSPNDQKNIFKSSEKVLKIKSENSGELSFPIAVAMGASWTQNSSTFYTGWPLAAIPIYYNPFPQITPTSSPVPPLIPTTFSANETTTDSDSKENALVTDTQNDEKKSSVPLEEINTQSANTTAAIPFQESWEPIPPKTPRRKTSEGQLKVLNKVFERWPAPSTSLRRVIGEEVEMCPRTVQVWFQNKRQNQKKQLEKNAGKAATGKVGEKVSRGKKGHRGGNGEDYDESMAEKLVREWASTYYTKTGIIYERPEKVEKGRRGVLSAKPVDPKNPIWVFETPYYQAKI
ncbi:hypothetical protein HK098_005181 [Nowakowskiella sp. JEL0407]|nr:hypothetical protein HK098_005181 [Nowakowskiella sp. JEL0407]